MQLKKSQYTTLLRFAFLPPSVMEFASRKYQFDHLAAYLQFSFEKNMKCSRIVENDNHAFFNTGLQNKAGDFLYAFFIPNENKRQKWALRYIASASELQITAAPDPPVCTLQDFERDFFDFAYAHSDKYQPLAASFSTVQEAREHIRRVFKNAHQLGYIIYENNQAIFHTGVKSADNAYYYAVFSKNKNARPEWYLNGFYTKPLGFSVLPEYVFEIEQQSAVSVSSTLLVSANIADLDALKTVLHEEQLRFSERSDRTAGSREFSYLSIPKLNAIAVLTGQSYHCFIPIIQAILRFHPAQAVFTETASDNITQSPTTISKAVRNPEQAERSDSDLEADPILCSLFSNLPNIPVHPVIETITDDQEGFYFAYICDEFNIPWVILKSSFEQENLQKDTAVSVWKLTVAGLKHQRSGG